MIKVTEENEEQAWREYLSTRDQSIEAALVDRYMKFLAWVAKSLRHLYPRKYLYDDMIGWGSFGLIKAIRLWTPSRGSFPNYARVAIRRHIDWGFHWNERDFSPYVVGKAPHMDSVSQIPPMFERVDHRDGPAEEAFKREVFKKYTGGSTREVKVLKLRLTGLDFPAIGNKFGCSSERVRQIYKGEITRIKNELLHA